MSAIFLCLDAFARSHHADAFELVVFQDEFGQFRSSRRDCSICIAWTDGSVCQGIAQIDVEIVGLTAKRREEAVTELRDVEPMIARLDEELAALELKLARLTLTAPTEGLVHDLRVHSLGAIIRSADPVLFIIPQEEALTITAKIDAYHIDEVFAGRPVILRFSAFNARTTPEINAEVAQVSADVTTDERTGLQYYTTEIRISGSELARLGDQPLLPGMPVEVFIQTGERSPLSYFAKPFSDYFERAFKD